MKYNTFKIMMTGLRRDIEYIKKHYKPCDQEDAVSSFVADVIYNNFWDYERDVPTCNADQMEILIQNTVRHLLHVY